MIPILYATTATTFDHNGIGRLSECTYCAVTEERNGVFELEMELPTTAKYFNDITVESVIVAQPRPGASGQPFRVYQITKPINGVVTLYARHISYELNKIIAMPFTASTCAAAFATFASKAATPCPFTFWTDKVVTANFRLQTPEAMRAILGGMSGSFLDVFGAGEYEFDGYNVKLYQNRGTDRGVTIRYGKNLTALEDSTDTENVYTGIVPFYHTDLATVTLPERVLWGEHKNDYPYGMTKPLDLSSEFEQPPTVAQLRTAAQSYLNKSTGWQIKNNIKISFVNLADTEEYKNIAVLERVNLCDTVTVLHPGIGVEATAKVVKVVYDVLQERYTSLELGATRTNLSQAITETIMEDVPTTSMMQEAIDHANKMITGGLGGYIVYNFNANGQPEELLIMNTPDKATATSVWRWNMGGLGHGSSYDTPASDIALTADGKINASMITTGKLNANIIQTGIIKGQAQGSTMQINVDTGIITLGNKALRITAGNFQLNSNGDVTITGKITTTSGSKLGAWTVSDSAIWRGNSTFGNAAGMYFGVNGLSLSNKFKVASNGTTTIGGKTSFNDSVAGIYLSSNDGIAIGAYAGGSGGTGFRASQSGRVEVGCIYFYTGNGTETAQYGLWAKGSKRIGSGGGCDFNSELDDECHLRGVTYIGEGGGGANVYGGMRLSGDLNFDTSHGYNIWGVDAIGARGAIEAGSVKAGGAQFNGVNSGACSLLSDERTKEDIEPLEDSAEFIEKLRPVRFKFKDRDGYHHGFIAQEVRELLPDDCDIVTETPNGMFGLRYQEIIADLVAVVQKQQKQIDRLESRMRVFEELYMEGDDGR